jgi:spermidine synthase
MIPWLEDCRDDGPLGFPRMATIVPAGQRGDVRVEHLEIADGGGIHAMLRGTGTRNGTYAILKVRGSVVMSDTDMERLTNIDAKIQARGDVLIGGLGLGMIVCPMFRNPAVRTITVIERNPDVIALVEPAIRAWAGRISAETVPSLRIVLGDVFTWKPEKGQKFDSIYFDIWPDICEDNLDGIAKLHNRAKSWKRPGGWMDSWQADTLRDRRRSDLNRGW